MTRPEKDDAANPYKDTLFLPKTDFPMRGGRPQQEPLRLAKWEAEDLYGQLRADAKKRGAKAFMLHDGPPYANGHIHIGTGAYQFSNRAQTEPSFSRRTRSND